jgi:hypothetical protein
LLPPAEATDVANAVLDGVDGLLLGAETLRGQHPVLTAQTVLKLCVAAEKVFDYHTHHETLMGEAFEVGRGKQACGWVGGWADGEGLRDRLARWACALCAGAGAGALSVLLHASGAVH